MGLLHGDAAWDYGVGLTGIARDIYGEGRASSESPEVLEIVNRHLEEEKRKKAFRELEEEDAHLLAIEDMNKKGLSFLEKGQVVPCTIKTYGSRDLRIFGKWHECEYAETDKGNLLRKKEISDYWYLEGEMPSIIRNKTRGERKKEIIEKCHIQEVHVGNDRFEVPCFKSVDHPEYAHWMWALMNNMCFHVKWDFDRSAEVLDEKFEAVSLDDLYSF